ncbi:hypothetical protein G7Z17_g8133 [Cylindrodendrum hubeiense]|uniref:CBM1 domain-containing protein n=1 Tax=Cylindrodendrum hubeiense TaxID=595255 RepID=A0A9P5LEM5_9HYPO|nr:hypothetical protein G7Z17_g8133 [Cylindrodendrum hubeiense]
MLFSGIPAIVLAGFTVAATALSDLDGSVWKDLESKQNSKRVFQHQSRNRPVKRATGWSPPSDLTTPLKEVWDHVVSTYDGGVDGNTNWGWHQVMANKGHLNICVRWDSNQTVTAAERTKIASVYEAQYQKWFKWVYGYNGFPYTKVDINIVGWAVKDTSLLEGSTTGYDVYTDLDADGIPMCNIGCSRDAHLDSDYSACAGGADSHFDQSLWLTDGLDGGFGYSWGQQVGREYFMNNIDTENIHILLHEMGHTFGLDDFYDWTPTGVTNFIMLAGASLEITDFDGWMYRNWWYVLSQENGWASSSAVTTSASAATSKAATTKTTAVAVTTEVAVEEATSTEEAVEATSTEEAIVEATSTEEAIVEATSTLKVATSAAFVATSQQATTSDEATTSDDLPTITPVAPVATPFLPTPDFNSFNSTPVATPTPSATPTGATAGRWQACGGGRAYTGATKCASGLKCVKHNDFYHQCL